MGGHRGSLGRQGPLLGGRQVRSARETESELFRRHSSETEHSRPSVELVLDGRFDLVPPILHFSKPRSGFVCFNGLCVLGDLERTWFEDRGQPVKNFRAHLTVLDEQFVHLEWLHRRARASSERELVGDGPPAWQRYQKGKVDRLTIWTSLIRKPAAQLPAAETPDDSIRAQLVSMSPTEFEAAVVSLFREWKQVTHSITRTRPTGDRGFDFYGEFILPPPLHYEIKFLGEAKRYGRETAVRPGAVSRLVARLSRGEYGIFVTTSYFTEQAQEEVYADRYPVRLLSGGDLVEMMKELRVAAKGRISPVWLRAVKEEFESRPWMREGGVDARL